jgi:hypothetical protein
MLRFESRGKAEILVTDIEATPIQTNL